MEYTILGRTGLKASVAGLGCGGPSRLGQRVNKSEKESIALVRLALDTGVNLIDTAEVYGTEEIVGKAVKGFSRDQVILSTKKTPRASDHKEAGRELRKGLEQSLRRLQTEYVDIFHLHGVKPEEYPYAFERLAPTLLKMRQEGKIRAVGITEAFVADPSHQMPQQALEDSCWDIAMVGFSILNQSARTAVFPKTLKGNVGVLVMFAVRRALSQTDRFKEVWTELKQEKLVDPAMCDADNPLGFLLEEGRVATIPEAAYRYCRHEPGVHVVLSGTGSPDHLKANIESLTKPPLPETVTARLKAIFARVDSVTGN